jgi:hypothetical protein
MTTMTDDNGHYADIDYDDKHDTTQWETRDRDGKITGGGQRGGNAVDEIVDEFKDRGFRLSHSG